MEQLHKWSPRVPVPLVCRAIPLEAVPGRTGIQGGEPHRAGCEGSWRARAGRG